MQQDNESVPPAMHRVEEPGPDLLCHICLILLSLACTHNYYPLVLPHQAERQAAAAEQAAQKQQAAAQLAASQQAAAQRAAAQQAWFRWLLMEGSDVF